MIDETLKQTLSEITDLADFTTSALEVTANSCAYKEDYATEDILRSVLNKQYNMIEKISSLQMFFNGL